MDIFKIYLKVSAHMLGGALMLVGTMAALVWIDSPIFAGIVGWLGITMAMTISAAKDRGVL